MGNSISAAVSFSMMMCFVIRKNKTSADWWFCLENHVRCISWSWVKWYENTSHNAFVQRFSKFVFYLLFWIPVMQNWWFKCSWIVDCSWVHTSWSMITYLYPIYIEYWRAASLDYSLSRFPIFHPIQAVLRQPPHCRHSRQTQDAQHDPHLPSDGNTTNCCLTQLTQYHITHKTRTVFWINFSWM